MVAGMFKANRTANRPEAVARFKFTFVPAHKPSVKWTTKMRSVYDNYLIFVLSQPYKKAINS